jgi:hypothetical protein
MTRIGRGDANHPLLLVSSHQGGRQSLSLVIAGVRDGYRLALGEAWLQTLGQQMQIVIRQPTGSVDAQHAGIVLEVDKSLLRSQKSTCPIQSILCHLCQIYGSGQRLGQFVKEVKLTCTISTAHFNLTFHRP